MPKQTKAVKSDSDPFWGCIGAKSIDVIPPGSDLTAFCFSTPAVLRTKVVSLHGLLGREHRTHYTRGQKATSVGLATGMSQGHGGTRPVNKVNKPVRRTWVVCLNEYATGAGRISYPPLVSLWT